MQDEFAKWKMQTQAEHDRKTLELTKQEDKLRNDTEIQKTNNAEESNKVSRENAKLKVQREMEISNLKNASETRIEQAKINLIKQEMDDKLMMLEAI